MDPTFIYPDYSSHLRFPALKERLCPIRTLKNKAKRIKQSGNYSEAVYASFCPLLTFFLNKSSCIRFLKKLILSLTFKGIFSTKGKNTNFAANAVDFQFHITSSLHWTFSNEQANEKTGKESKRSCFIELPPNT